MNGVKILMIVVEITKELLYEENAGGTSWQTVALI